jgi:tmRNA-binding protein
MAPSLVVLQTIALTISLFAQVTLKRFLSGVSARVKFQTIRCHETFLTHITVEHLSGVNTHVAFQSTRCRKALIAHIALVRFLSSVNAHMYDQS